MPVDLDGRESHELPRTVALWDAINDVVAASGGSTTNVSVARQKAVVRVHDALRPLAEELRTLRARVAELEEERRQAIESGDYDRMEEPNDLSKVFGSWPGDESDEEIEALLSERTPEEETLHDALRRYGFKEQLAMLQEECGELVAAVSRYRRGRPGAFEAMIDEMADVSILIKQIKLVYEDEIEQAEARKLARLRERLG